MHLLLQRELVLSFQREELTKPLLVLPAALEAEALEMFRRVQKAMGDIFSFTDDSKKEILNAAAESDLLRDEVYVQIIKQLRQNTNFNSIIKGFLLLAALCEASPPSPQLLPYVRHMLELHATQQQQQQQQQQPLLLLLQPPTATAAATTTTNPVAAAATVRQLTPREREVQQICSKALQALERHTKEIATTEERNDKDISSSDEEKQTKSSFDVQVI